MDARIVGGDQNHTPIIPLSIVPLLNSNAAVVILVGGSGDQIRFEEEFKTKFFDSNSSKQITYMGRYLSATAVSGDGGCIIDKFLYLSNGVIKASQRLTGTWSGHTSLAWTIV